MRTAAYLLCLMAIPALAADDVEPKPSRSQFDIKLLRNFVSTDLGTPYSQGSLRKLGEPTRVVHGRVVDHTGQPIANAQVSFSTHIGYFSKCYDEHFDITDELGRFLVEGDMTLNRIVVRRDEGQLWQVQVAADQKVVDVEWPIPAGCTITVDDSILKDTAFGSQLSVQTTSYWVGMSSLQRRTTVGEDGQVVLKDLLPAEYSVVMQKSVALGPDGENAKSTPVEVARFTVKAGENAVVSTAVAGKRSLSGQVCTGAEGRGRQSGSINHSTEVVR